MLPTVIYLIDAIRRAGSTNAAEIVQALDQTRDFEGATIQKISFTPQNHVALKLEDLGTYEMLKRGDRVVLELRD